MDYQSTGTDLLIIPAEPPCLVFQRLSTTRGLHLIHCVNARISPEESANRSHPRICTSCRGFAFCYSSVASKGEFNSICSNKRKNVQRSKSPNERRGPP
ncbi:hypothetical protein Q1695_010572 [Nippostrongylus brasiliensis]|nr:hypothetical protein Q1695_010572 [Nippostrongylus brasiliensis]